MTNWSELLLEFNKIDENKKKKKRSIPEFWYCSSSFFPRSIYIYTSIAIGSTEIYFHFMWIDWNQFYKMRARLAKIASEHGTHAHSFHSTDYYGNARRRCAHLVDEMKNAYPASFRYTRTLLKRTWSIDDGPSSYAVKYLYIIPWAFDRPIKANQITKEREIKARWRKIKKKNQILIINFS